ncbi:thioredoxin family protein [Nocardioides mangrovi]|uniref:Thioredoxin family protein n=1 Tax=Nocardioides mangrovi TaxID=2874580 RepID=A0ABS7UC95_9ACTN|nr:thioredoxin family protein [Nocardioides mangrovi]MBZ5738495.1 thioredoxin family protein [Nocardioides mangrovi]
MSTGAWIAVAAVAVALAVGTYRLLTDGRFRGTRSVVEVRGASATSLETTSPDDQSVWTDVQAAMPDAVAGEQATLVQFSSAFCAPCRATRRVLTEVADLVPGVTHVEVDAEHHLELVRRLGVLRTPTTLVLDGAGNEVTRATGAPRKEQVLAALGRA